MFRAAIAGILSAPTWQRQVSCGSGGWRLWDRCIHEMPFVPVGQGSSKPRLSQRQGILVGEIYIHSQLIGRSWLSAAVVL